MLAEETSAVVGLERELTLCWYDGIGVRIPRPCQNPQHNKLQVRQRSGLKKCIRSALEVDENKTGSLAGSDNHRLITGSTTLDSLHILHALGDYKTITVHYWTQTSPASTSLKNTNLPYVPRVNVS
ncbi:hypothetical protein BaRGS_00018623 [Batillaria attramentaria]|uniref:Uncharacterized protein n=1 Tax=Batillaria attramentaria TaxID=370345 RepID=A0ABD0KSS1_9CAEN